uniref:Uncharacterized protein n=1 Tax=Anguilla anguilla TaxID=7936 RepID=A0A0E9UPR8_ANGAN
MNTLQCKINARAPSDLSNALFIAILSNMTFFVFKVLLYKISF